jgi:hypothetical protein
LTISRNVTSDDLRRRFSDSIRLLKKAGAGSLLKLIALVAASLYVLARIDLVSCRFDYGWFFKHSRHLRADPRDRTKVEMHLRCYLSPVLLRDSSRIAMRIR